MARESNGETHCKGKCMKCNEVVNTIVRYRNAVLQSYETHCDECGLNEKEL
jgi:hypothetical protein